VHRLGVVTLADLPADMIPYAAQALAHYAKGEVYAERGWD
jgi:8-oxo-dGTP diphosphatase